MQTTLKKIFSTLCLGGAFLTLTPSLPAAAQVKDADELVYPPLPTVEMPTPQRVVLKNGLVVMLIEDHELPLVTARIMVRTGSRWEDENKVGLAALTAQVMRSGGTKNLASDELDDLLEDRAASIETSSNRSSGSVFLSCLKEDFPEMLGLLRDIVRFPVFDTEKLEVAKAQVVSGISRQNDSASQILNREYRKLIYGAESPYARNSTYETIDSIHRDDLVAFHTLYYHPDRMILGLVGDFDRKDVLNLVEEVFGDWPKGHEVQEPEVWYQKKANPGVFFVEKNDVTQSNIQMGHLGLRRDHPDYYAVTLMNQVLGGSFAARLFSRVRSEKGLAYGVFGRVTSQWDYPGLFLMSMSTKKETTAAGLEALLLEAKNMISEPPTDKEVEKARAGLLNSFVFSADSIDEILNRQMTYEYYGYPLDWLAKYREGIESVTTAQVRKAAVDHIHLEDFSILVVGPSEGTDRPLSEFGEVVEIDITIPEPEVPEIEMTAEGKKKGTELISLAVEGIGGAEALVKLASLRIHSTMEVNGPEGSMKIQTKALISLPNRLRFESVLPFGTMAQVLNGEGSFVQTPLGTQPMAEGARHRLASTLNRLAPVLLMKRHEEGFLAMALGESEIEGTAVQKVHVEWAGEAQTLGIDAEGRILSIEYRGPINGGAPGDIFQTFSDFRQVEGLLLPFVSTTKADGALVMSGMNDLVEVNSEVDEAAFKMPQ
jgi:predicted Zn-dependent peptidase